MDNSNDLFGYSPAQGSLFGDGENRMQPSHSSDLPDPKNIRERLTSLLDLARNAAEMPWPAKEARMWQTVFPNMANWLPEEEAKQLRFQFAIEYDRLSKAA